MIVVDAWGRFRDEFMGAHPDTEGEQPQSWARTIVIAIVVLILLELGLNLAGCA